MANEPDVVVDAPIAGTKYRVNPLLADRVNRLIADAPPEIQPDLQHAITSGFRTHAQQMQAYLHYLAGGGLAARPGHSLHERDHGMAVDWNNITPRGWAYLKDHAIDYGLGFPLGSRDPYHMQPVETYAGTNKGLYADKTDTSPAPKTTLPDVDVTAEKTPPPPPRPVQSVDPSQLVQNRQLGQIITKPLPMNPPPRFVPLRAPRGTVRAPNLGAGFSNALRRILAGR